MGEAMRANEYKKLILDVLQGQTPELRDIPRERLDWSGPGALLELYSRTSGKDRAAIIQAIGDIIRNHGGPPAVIAQLVDIASGLDLAEVQPDILALQDKPGVSAEPLLRESINNYLAYRKLMANGRPTTSIAGSAPRPASRKSPPRKR
jgi:hypothetical protein